MKYTTDWITESTDEILAPCDVRLSTILEVSTHNVRLDDGIDNGWYYIPDYVGPVVVGQQVVARIPWDDYGYIELPEDGDI